MAKVRIQMSLKGVIPPIKKQMGGIMMSVASEARDEWVRMARKELRTSAPEYINGIGDPKKKSGNTVEIRLKGQFPNMLEGGAEPWDMKPAMLRSPKAKRGKGGKYITVPFFLKSPGSIGGEPPVMPGPIYRKALKLGLGQSMQLPKTYEGYGIRSRLSADIKRWGHYTWKSSPFEGITRVRSFPGLTPLGLPREQAGRFATFRRISKKSDPNSWVHPGFQPRNFIDKVSNKLQDIFPKVLDRFVS